jgi:glycosyltransferase involved in cell wall biosynthesis
LEGSFQVDDKPEIYSKTDLINAVYANSATNLSFGDSTPIPNRLYDAIVFKCPLVASKGTYLAELIEKYQIGIVVNGFDDDVEQQLIQYTINFNAEKFLNGCEELLSEVMFEEGQFIERVTSLLNSWKDTNVSKF